MKKLLFVLMALVVMLALVACGGPADETLPQGDDTTIPADHVHAYEEVTTAATCTTAGKTEVKCACGDVQSTTELPLADHTPSAKECDKDTVCTVCNTVLAEKTGHKVASFSVVTAATCSATGKEQGACEYCGTFVVNEIPTKGHTPAADGTVTYANGGFSITCANCSQNVVLNAQDPILNLTFDVPVEEQSANDYGLEVAKPKDWKIADGKLQIFGTQNYINVSDADKLVDLGAFLISFDFMSTKEEDVTKAFSVVSLLSNCQSGAKTAKGDIGWGWIVKLVEENDTLATVSKAELTNGSNSVAVERNKMYNVKLVVIPNAQAVHVFIDGKYIGNSKAMQALSTQGMNNCCFRFGDAPNCGLLFDNIVIADLK